MDNLFFAADGSASAFASAQLYELGSLGIVRFAVDTTSGTALRHECIRHRETREHAMQDACHDGSRLVRRWLDERAPLSD